MRSRNLLLAPLLAVGACRSERLLEAVPQFTVAPRDVLIQEGMVLQMKALIPAEGTQLTSSITWKSSSPEIASVDANGLVTAVAPGTAKITAVSDSSRDSATVSVHERIDGSISTSGATTCGLTATAAVCWGHNIYGQTGAPRSSPIAFTPVAVPASVTWRSIDGSWNHTCGVDTQFDIYCWGLNTVGQLGMGTESEAVIPSRKVVSDKKFVQVSAGGAEWQPNMDVELLNAQMTCGLTREGEAYCWGRQGDFATSGEVQTSTPKAVAPGLRFASISVGNGYACGISIDRRAYCWGNNDLGQLGRARSAFDRGVRPVEGNLEFERVSAGGLHACALTRDGTPYCWGVNQSQQLGTTSTEQCLLRGISLACQTHPVRVNTSLKLKAISAGAWGLAPTVFDGFRGYVSHTCGLTTSQDLVCWGYNLWNEIWRRLDFTEPPTIVTPMQLPFLEKFRAVVAGAFHTCAVLVNNHTWCWGDVSRGQLGVPQGTNTYNSFVEIAGGYVFK